MDIETELDKSEAWMVQSNTLIDGTNFETTKERRASVALFHLALEHQSAIHLLVHNHVWGSALVLLRPQFEAYVRGLWFEHCASEEQVDSFLTGKEPPKIGKLIEAIEQVEAFGEKSLSSVKKSLWGKLNDYTHGGTIQVIARNRKDEIASNYNPEHMCGVLQSAAVIAYSASLEIAKVADSEELATKLMKLHKDLYQENL
ncbi:DUF6988 family protein [Thiobacillus denitrificans]|uniref:DUF6988 family protein n=1 Tax=Thiobacillus denitrificans TaxID=36861 RepID=UPI000476971D|nr:hypothetical protein [Thiobacillus denitrificans]